MALQSHTIERVGSESLDEKWEKVGCGGFGQVYKTRHKEWGFDVAVKILRAGVGSFLEEANHMQMASCQFVLRIYGVFEGCVPFGTMSSEKGIVMQFMGKGSVETMQKKLSGPPPWPLAFRLANEVALGINFLHKKKLMHSDLKPSNVLLDDDLHAKLADFGLSRVSTSVLNSTSETTGEVGGSYKYMPPEAFNASYKPVRAFDIYSYGVFLWSIITGKEPYESADYSLVALKIPLGDRPCMKEINPSRAEGLEELIDLMESCWDGDPSNRPNFEHCCDVTEAVFIKHKPDISKAVDEVLTTLESPGFTNQTPELSELLRSHNATDLSEEPRSHDTVDHIRDTTPERPLAQQDVVSVSTKEMNVADKAKFISDNKAKLIQRVSDVLPIVDELGDMVHQETYSVIKGLQTSQQQMRELYQKSFRSGGEKVKAAFYDILTKHHAHLVESLGGQL